VILFLKNKIILKGLLLTFFFLRILVKNAVQTFLGYVFIGILASFGFVEYLWVINDIKIYTQIKSFSFRRKKMSWW
jgi:hypothetical protein